MKIYRAFAGFVAAVLFICGCAAGGRELHRPEGAGRLPLTAKIGLTEFKRCGAAYLDRLNPTYYGQDAKAGFLLECTELGYPKTFQNRLRQRLEERLGKKLAMVRSDKPFLAKTVLHDGEKQGLDYVLAGDLLAMGETAREAVAASQLYAVRVADRKVVRLGLVKKTDARGKMQNVIDAVADELYVKVFAD